MKLIKLIKLILKAILFYGSAIFWILFICGADSILEENLFWQFLIVGIIDIISLYIFVSSEDIDIITFN